ncbi:T9SS type A sorting domain-containing protein [Rubrivirga litoralis]|uniref:T9SS type A sorting domain-containing protein n=1 Tax=Rubrivirga litoralis TaxID=3075598 RepID=A0ABU3BNR0_9BACT|nr:T9SS type A sorting domain-containing protein [Rubrivirga sp. F394]MDT0630913.1 T9SS type A sorting domain-containing protein [Rubrivirga sp. F394]
MAQTQTCPADQAVCAVENGQLLNRVINRDTTVTGERAREDRVYQLARDAIYLYDGNVRNSGYHLRVFGAPGDGPLPQVYATVNQNSGNVPGDWVRQEGDVTFRDFAFSGIIEDPVLNPDGLTIIPAGVVRVEQPGFTLTIDGTVWSNTRNRFVRAESALKALFLTNSVWVNSGYNGPSGGNLGVGKAIDLRDGSIDSLVIRNTTFANYTDRIIRHRGSTGPIRTMIFDHNTIINAFSYHGMMALGQVGDKIQITNNLFVDPFVAGGDTSDVVRQSEFDESGEVYASNGQPEMFWVFTEPSGNAEFEIANNVYVISPEVEAFYDRFGDGMGNDGNPDNGTDGDNDILDEGTKLTDFILDRIENDAAAFVEGDFELVNRPAPMVNLGEWYRTEARRTKATETFDPATDDYDRKTLAYYLESGDFDASYPASANAYTAATGGCPVGDLNWFPTRYDACTFSVANESGPGQVTGAVRLFPTAPNPTRGSATVTYSLDRPVEVEVTLVNMIGQTVATLTPRQMQQAGTHTLRWDGAAGQALASGVYVVRLQAGDAVVTSRMTIVR